MTALFELPKPTLPGYVHGIVSVDPPQIQCDGCGVIAEGPNLNLLVLTCGIRFHRWDRYTRRLCAECRGPEASS